MENVGTGQRLQFLVPVPNRLPAHATVELQLFHALQELHHLLPDLRLLPLAPMNPFTEAVDLQRAQLQEQKTKLFYSSDHCRISLKSCSNFLNILLFSDGKKSY